MSNITTQLGQTKKYLVKNGKKVEMPYRTMFSFREEYPYTMLELGVPQLRIDHLTKKLTGTPFGWKILCLFNDVLFPSDLLARNTLYIPEDFSKAITWLAKKNIRL
jgi:hypothetical protein